MQQKIPGLAAIGIKTQDHQRAARRIKTKVNNWKKQLLDIKRI